MAEATLYVGDLKLFTIKDMYEARTMGYLECAEEHGMLNFIDTDLNCMGINVTDEPDED